GTNRGRIPCATTSKEGRREGEARGPKSPTAGNEAGTEGHEAGRSGAGGGRMMACGTYDLPCIVKDLVLVWLEAHWLFLVLGALATVLIIFGPGLKMRLVGIVIAAILV